jgi:hypothetical protein
VAGTGGDDVPIASRGVWAAWPLALASTPGGYLGAAALLAVPFAFRDRARRFLVVALASIGLIANLRTSTLLVGAGWFRSVALSLPFGDVYLHNPSRFRYAAFLVVPALGAIGVQWLVDRRPSFREAAPWLAGGLGVLLAFPLLAGADPRRLVVFAAASAAVIVVVRALAVGRRWAPVALVGVLSLELLAGPCGRAPTEAGPSSTGSRATTIPHSSPRRSAGPRWTSATTWSRGRSPGGSGVRTAGTCRGSCRMPPSTRATSSPGHEPIARRC